MRAEKVSAPAVHCLFDKMVQLEKLKPHPKNRNKHSAEQLERLAGILKYQGFRYPVKVSKRSGHVTSGHGRIEAARLNGWKSVPVNFQQYDSDDQEYADVQADNAIASWAELDLTGIHGDLGELGPDFDKDMLGIKDFSLEIEQVEGQCDPDEVPDAPAEPRTKLGDVYQLGNHRLMCGDSTSIDAVEKLMGGVKADMVFTDPPYNHGSENQMQALSELRPNSYGKLKDADWDKDFSFEAVGATLLCAMAENVSVYVTTSHHLAGDIWTWAKTWAQLTGYCVWTKPSPMPSLHKRHWTWATEIVCYATRGKHTFNFPDQGHALNYWSFKRDEETGLHPTMKPVGVPEHAIVHSSALGAKVLDLFGGSGSTLIAAEKTGRSAYLMELSPKYCDVIVARWEKFTGKKAELLNG